MDKKNIFSFITENERLTEQKEWMQFEFNEYFIIFNWIAVDLKSLLISEQNKAKQKNNFSKANQTHFCSLKTQNCMIICINNAAPFVFNKLKWFDFAFKKIFFFCFALFCSEIKNNFESTEIQSNLIKLKWTRKRNSKREFKMNPYVASTWITQTQILFRSKCVPSFINHYKQPWIVSNITYIFVFLKFIKEKKKFESIWFLINKLVLYSISI